MLTTRQVLLDLHEDDELDPILDDDTELGLWAMTTTLLGLDLSARREIIAARGRAFEPSGDLHEDIRRSLHHGWIAALTDEDPARHIDRAHDLSLALADDDTRADLLRIQALNYLLITSSARGDRREAALWLDRRLREPLADVVPTFDYEALFLGAGPQPDVSEAQLAGFAARICKDAIMHAPVWDPAPYAVALLAFGDLRSILFNAADRLDAMLFDGQDPRHTIKVDRVELRGEDSPRIDIEVAVGGPSAWDPLALGLAPLAGEFEATLAAAIDAPQLEAARRNLHVHATVTSDEPISPANRSLLAARFHLSCRSFVRGEDDRIREWTLDVR